MLPFLLIVIIIVIIIVILLPIEVSSITITITITIRRPAADGEPWNCLLDGLLQPGVYFVDMPNLPGAPRQRTLRREVLFSGIGLHTGQEGTLRIAPAGPGEGRVFYREGRRVPALAENVAPSARCTRLAADGAEVLTPEHVLAALYGLRVDNARLELEGPEVPILDGSALPYAQAIREAGIVAQEAAARILMLSRPVWAADGHRHVLALPADGFAMTVATAFGRLGAGPAVLHLHFPQNGADDAAGESFLHQLAPARTFCFQDEVEAILAAGLGAGGSLENALVLSDEGPSRPLRFDDELIRHKALDLLGDLALLGGRLAAHVIAVKAGHALHTAAAEQIRRIADDTIVD
jgi:UDP-3-O-[3-hydroxymyristoyl] N-acetylglucosamine deacetylase